MHTHTHARTRTHIDCLTSQSVDYHSIYHFRGLICLCHWSCFYLYIVYASVHFPNIFKCLVYYLMYIYTLHTLAYLYAHSYTLPLLAYLHTHQRTRTYTHKLFILDFVCILTRLCPLYEPGGLDTSSPIGHPLYLRRIQVQGMELYN